MAEESIQSLLNKVYGVTIGDDYVSVVDGNDVAVATYSRMLVEDETEDEVIERAFADGHLSKIYYKVLRTTAAANLEEGVFVVLEEAEAYLADLKLRLSDGEFAFMKTLRA